MTPSERAELPETVGLCPDPSHTGEFYMPDGGGDTCPHCDKAMALYMRVPEGERGVSLSDEELGALTKVCWWHRADDPLVTAYVKLSAALQQGADR